MKSMYRSICGLILVSIMAACDSTTEVPPPPPPPATGTITGSILVEGETLAGVTVNLAGPESASTVSGSGGTFTFTAVQEGQYTVSISGFSSEVQFAQTTNAVTVAGGQTATVSFNGTFVRTASISGSVLVDGTGVAEATLTLAGPESATSTSDANGEFSFPGLRAGTFTVTLSGFAADLTFAVVQRQVTIGVGDAATIEFVGIQELPATVSIFALEDDRGFRINVNGVHDELFVLVDVEQGTQTVTKVTLFLNAENVGEQELSAPTTAFGQQLAPQRLRFEINTTQFDANTGGPLFPNGPGTLRVVADTEQQGAGAAETTLAITLDNRDLIAGINFLGGAGGVVSGGHAWWGGGDLDFEVIPVIYDPNLTLSAIDIRALGEASANGGSSLDFGSGLGVAHRVTGPPFTFTAPRTLNDGFVEDDPTREGHTISVVGVFDGTGQNISSDFIPGRTTALEGLFVDFVGPQVPPGTRLEVDGATILGGEWFSLGTLGLSVVSEFGVGGITPQFDASVGGSVVEPDVKTIDDLPERGLLYSLALESVVDDLGNEGPAANVIVTNPFGVDRTPVDLTGVLPVGTIILNPDDDGGDGIADNQVSFTAADPLLTDGSPGSGYGVGTAVGVDGAGTVIDLSSKIAPNATGANTLDPFILPEETYTFDLAVTDNATPANTASASVSFILDRTKPSTSMVNPPPGNTTLTLSSVTWPITGSVADANGISSVFLRVRDADAGGSPGVCEVTDPLIPIGTGPGQVNQNTFDLTADASGFSVDVQIFKKGVNVTQVVCFFIEAADVATGVDGNLEPNINITVLRTSIDWL